MDTKDSSSSSTNRAIASVGEVVVNANTTNTTTATITTSTSTTTTTTTTTNNKNNNNHTKPNNDNKNKNSNVDDASQTKITKNDAKNQHAVIIQPIVSHTSSMRRIKNFLAGNQRDGLNVFGTTGLFHSQTEAERFKKLKHFEIKETNPYDFAVCYWFAISDLMSVLLI